MKRLIPLLLSLLLLFTTSTPFTAQAGQLPPEVLLDLEGKPQPFSQWEGKILILNFWATWCPPCRREMPTFIELQQEYGDRGVQFVGVAVDNPKMAARFSSDHGIYFPSLQGEINGLDLSISLGNRRSVLPYTVIFDREGDILLQKPGELRRKQILSVITPIL